MRYYNQYQQMDTVTDIPTLDINGYTVRNKDKGPVTEDIDLVVTEGSTHSVVQLPDSNLILREKQKKIMNEVIDENHAVVTVDKKDTVAIP